MPLLGVALLACASTEVVRTPERAVGLFSRALIEHRPEVAYGLMAPAFRKQIDLEGFARRMQENEQEALVLADLLGRSPKERSEPVGASHGDRMLRYHGVPQPICLELEEDSYRIATPMLDFYNQDSPREALRSFLRAVEARRFDVVLRLLPNDDKFGLSQQDLRQAWRGERREDLERVLSNLNQALETPSTTDATTDATDAIIEFQGDHATMTYAGHLQAQFVREGEHWKIIAPE